MLFQIYQILFFYLYHGIAHWYAMLKCELIICIWFISNLLWFNQLAGNVEFLFLIMSAHVLGYTKLSHLDRLSQMIA